MDIEEIGNIKLPIEFKKILNQFEQKYNEDGFSKIASYIGFDWIVDKDQVREYELVPFEAELPFPTGSNGEHMGWLNLCPSLENYRKPFICWVPLGQHIFYHGASMKEIFENSVRYLHSPKYENIDLDFLSDLEIEPQNGKEIKLINYDNEPLNKIPLKLPKEYQYEITIDGVGVVSKSKYFSKQCNYAQIELGIDEYIELAKENLKKLFYGTTMFFLKEGYYRNFYEKQKQPQIMEILKLKEEAYTKLKMGQAAIQVGNEIKRRKDSSL